MKTWDKIILGILALMALFLFLYGFKASTGYAISVSGAAVEIGKIGVVFWLGLLGIMIVALVLIKVKGRR